MSTLAEELKRLVARVHQAKSGNAYRKFIDFIVFPKYRSFEAMARMDFTFPVTVLVGPNGSGKTSLLHALSGAPHGKSTGTWWFATAIDPIDDDGEQSRITLDTANKSAFWYGYKEAGTEHQVIKMRIRRRGDPDYWEPSRRVAAHGMQTTPGTNRSPAIDMDVTYLNFKTQLNAFDRCFYFIPEATVRKFDKQPYWRRLSATFGNRTRPARIQDYLRARSRHLRRVMIEGKPMSVGKHRMHKPLVRLTPSELRDVSEIIGKSYSAGLLLEHRFYENWGTSVLFTTAHGAYSEAFAGSGEAAVVRLVHQVHSSAAGALLLMDEPETSLHPGAQERLLRFLLRTSLEKKLQVVISTHSPAMVRHLPSSAIKVLTLTAEGSVRFIQEVSPDEAFFVLGHPPENTIELIVEDVLSKKLVEAVLKQLGDAIQGKCLVTFRPEGESALKQDAVVFMAMAHRKPFILLDGDQRPSDSIFDLSLLPMTSTASDLDDVIANKFRCRVRFREDSGMDEQARIKLRTDYMTYCNSHIRYLPFSSPEEVLWDQATAERLALTFIGDQRLQQFQHSCESAADAKGRFDLLTRSISTDPDSVRSTNIGVIHDMFLSKFCNDQGPAFRDLKGILAEITQ